MCRFLALYVHHKRRHRGVQSILTNLLIVVVNCAQKGHGALSNYPSQTLSKYLNGYIHSEERVHIGSGII